MLPTVAIVGRPNVGKSTIFNRIAGERKAITDDVPGVTRDRIYGKATWLSQEFTIIDTGGIALDDAPFLSEIKAQAEIAIEESDVIVFVTDLITGITHEDRNVMLHLIRSGKPVIVAVNKYDREQIRDNLYEFYELGVEKIIPVSGIHGIGMGDLLDAVIEKLPEPTSEPYDEDTIRFSVIGQQNVGKSSLTNTILGTKRVLVSEQGGTTTDAIDTPFVRGEQKYVIIDTAGLKKRGKVYESLDKYSYLRAMQAIERSDVCLVMIDPIEGIRAQDKHIAGFALDANKAIVLVVNKTDRLKETKMDKKAWTTELRTAFKFIPYAPIVFVSSKTGKNIEELFMTIAYAFDNYDKRIPTGVLNDTIRDAMLLNPPKDHKGKRVKVYYATQVSRKPPTFVFFVNDANCMHFSYKRYLENRIRAVFDLNGTPIRMILRKRS